MNGLLLWLWTDAAIWLGRLTIAGTGVITVAAVIHPLIHRPRTRIRDLHLHPDHPAIVRHARKDPHT